MLTVPDLDELRRLRARGEFFWLDLAGPDSSTLADVAAVLGLHELALEDTQEFGQRPKIDTYPHEMLLVYFGARMNGEANPEPAEVHVHISERFVLPVHREDKPFTDVHVNFRRFRVGLTVHASTEIHKQHLVRIGVDLRPLAEF